MIIERRELLDITAKLHQRIAELESENKSLLNERVAANASLWNANEKERLMAEDALCLRKERESLQAENKALRIDVAKRAGAALDRALEFQDLEKENKSLLDRMRAMEEILEVYVGHTCVADGKGNFIGAENCPAHRWEAMKANSSNFTPAT